MDTSKLLSTEALDAIKAFTQAEIEKSGVYQLNEEQIKAMKTKVGVPSATYINLAMIYLAYGCGVYRINVDGTAFKMTSSNQRTMNRGALVLITAGMKFCVVISANTGGPQLDFFYNSSTSAPTSYSAYPDKWNYTSLSEAWVKNLATINSMVTETRVKELIASTTSSAITGKSFNGNANNMIGGNGQFLSWSGSTIYYFAFNNVWRNYTVKDLDSNSISLSNAGAFGEGHFLIKTTNTSNAGQTGFIYSANAAGTGDYNTPGKWRTLPLPEELVGLSFTKMYYVNNRFYLLNTSGKGAYSEDFGASWTVFDFPAVSPSGFTYGNGIYIMTTMTTGTYRSTDGVTFEQTISNSYPGGVAFNGTVFLLPSGGVMYYTADGLSTAKWASGKSYHDGPVCEGVGTFAWALCGTSSNSNNTSSSYVSNSVFVYKHGDTGGYVEHTLGDSGSCRALVFNGVDYGILRGSFHVIKGDFGRDDLKNNYQDRRRFTEAIDKINKKIAELSNASSGTEVSGGPTTYTITTDLQGGTDSEPDAAIITDEADLAVIARIIKEQKVNETLFLINNIDIRENHLFMGHIAYNENGSCEMNIWQGRTWAGTLSGMLQVEYETAEDGTITITSAVSVIYNMAYQFNEEYASHSYVDGKIQALEERIAALEGTTE